MIDALALGQMTVQSFSKLEQISEAKGRAPYRGFHEGIGRQYIGQISRKRALCSVTVKVEHPIRAPCLAAFKEFVAGPTERMKRMSYGEPATLILGIGCS